MSVITRRPCFMPAAALRSQQQTFALVQSGFTCRLQLRYSSQGAFLPSERPWRRRQVLELIRQVQQGERYRERLRRECQLPLGLWDLVAQRISGWKLKRLRRWLRGAENLLLTHKQLPLKGQETLSEGAELSCAAHAPQELVFRAMLAYCRQRYGEELGSLARLAVCADLSLPATWFPLARARKRKVIYHAGKTNSGKTHQALQRFLNAESGVYCGPLRLLAWEVYDRLNKQGIACILRTGQEFAMPPGSPSTANVKDAAMMPGSVSGALNHALSPKTDDHEEEDEDEDEEESNASAAFDDERIHLGRHAHSGLARGVALDQSVTDPLDFPKQVRFVSCTVEMADLYRPVQVAIVDEVQMIAERERGGAWTRAILGLPADELHLCGCPSAVDVVRAMIEEDCHEQLEVRTYERLGPLRVSEKALGETQRQWSRGVRAGDCFVTFSRRELFRIKHQLERNAIKPLQCAVIYGSLPPETRREQAQLFNEADTHSILVATDAVGMGLNLNIRRMIFSALDKFDGTQRRPLTTAEILQIAGRAGRYAGPDRRPQCGEVTAFRQDDLRRLRSILHGAGIDTHGWPASIVPEKVTKAGLSPTREMMEAFAARCTAELASRSASGDDLMRRAATKRPPLSELYEKFENLAQVDASGRYFVCDLTDVKRICRLLERARVDEWMTFDLLYSASMAPLKLDDAAACEAMVQFMRAFTTSGVVRLTLQQCGSRMALRWLSGAPQWSSGPRTVSELRELESLYHVLDLYNWFANRYTDAFVDRDRASELRQRCAEAVARGLANLSQSAIEDEHDDMQADTLSQRRPRRTRYRLRLDENERLQYVSYLRKHQPLYLR
ncbi:probable mitochondrial ATP-dependent RNA helicase Suv3 [Cyanidioschyzon merolae strain 10D]|uniref:Probable mitochondrial ATP-dependent RNA helicase Suv3 n=1 Tax=Cyanidioschyzon merolae (strain NIES-3377 / 10D) TaxID=280699 RepID=M1V645_CYAM1|nr:probable mitochondrial ATP-dependent RNA helicase Suv3 [Cyanidioschyzon merolae strain 10D]BAM81780.1 probable mitochondrial ATP-dependent RNA helicase Suv3 [Cyanidioschyzon merolae strain 10D]|eukprot:XP_005537816.1 probable mitochondrial ATP-dependent RNA helicase Suv3 [Cyanidioschyzon merolae strain 10D]